MFNIGTIQKCLAGLVGFRQPLDPCVSVYLPPTLSTSDSGLYVEDVNGLLSIANIQDSFTDVASYSYETYSSTATYLRGKKVTDGANVYVSLQSGNTGNALSNTLFWQDLGAIPDFTAQLQALYDNALQKVVSRVFEKKTALTNNSGQPVNLYGVAKNLLQSQALYDAPNAGTAIETKQRRFVGFFVKLHNKQSFQIQVPQIGLRLTQAQTLPIYIYHVGNNAPVFVGAANYTTPRNFQWCDVTDTNGLPIVLNHRSNNDEGGVYFVGYYEDDLVGDALIYVPKFDSCTSCARHNYQSYQCLQKYRKYLQQPMFFAVNYNDLPKQNDNITPNREMFDVADALVERDTNFGINAKISVWCDVSWIICENRQSFAKLLQLQIAYDLLERMLNTVRNNRIAEVVRNNALYEMKGEDNYNSIINQIKRAETSLNFDFSELDPVCLPCNKFGVFTTSA